VHIAITTHKFAAMRAAIVSQLWFVARCALRVQMLLQNRMFSLYKGNGIQIIHRHGEIPQGFSDPDMQKVSQALR
jgi:hypothetical protein